MSGDPHIARRWIIDNAGQATNAERIEFGPATNPWSPVVGVVVDPHHADGWFCRPIPPTAVDGDLLSDNPSRLFYDPETLSVPARVFQGVR